MQNFNGFLRGLAVFLGWSVPAALVNSGLRLFQKQIQLAFMLRLSRHLHQLYCSNRSYYSASVLGGAPPLTPWQLALGVHASCNVSRAASGAQVLRLTGHRNALCYPTLRSRNVWQRGGCSWQSAGLTNADQRITEDVEKFCFAVRLPSPTAWLLQPQCITHLFSCSWHPLHMGACMTGVRGA